jgi:hypothetical protein
MAALLYKDFFIIATGQFDKAERTADAHCRYKLAFRHWLRGPHHPRSSSHLWH